MKSNEMCMLWIVDFPLCEVGDGPNSLVTVHHPFTAPHPADIEKLQSSPLTVCCSFNIVNNFTTIFEDNSLMFLLNSFLKHRFVLWHTIWF